jgi:hypothetical protein
MTCETGINSRIILKCEAKAVPPHAMKALGGKGGIAPTHSLPRL